MRIKITKKNQNQNVWFNNYINKEFDVLSIDENNLVTVSLPSSCGFSFPVKLLMYNEGEKPKKGFITRKCFDFIL